MWRIDDSLRQRVEFERSLTLLSPETEGADFSIGEGQRKTFKIGVALDLRKYIFIGWMNSLVEVNLSPEREYVCRHVRSVWSDDLARWRLNLENSIEFDQQQPCLLL